MINHVVMFKFKSTAAAAERQAYIEELRSLGKKSLKSDSLTWEKTSSRPRAHTTWF